MRSFAIAPATLAAGLGLLGSACASSANIEEELSRMRRDLASIKQDLGETKQEVQRLESRVTLLALGQDRVQPSPTTAPVQTTRPSANKRIAAAHDRVLPVVRLGSKASPAAAVTDEGWVDPGASDDGGPPVMLKLGPEHDPHDRLSVDREVLKKPDPVLKGEEDKLAYEQALALLREAGRPAEALTRFSGLLRDHPTSKWADNSAYWVGECHFQLKAYEAAIKAFDALAQDHPRSDKLADGLTRSGEAWLQLANKDRGRAILAKVVRDYPGSEAAGRAALLLSAEGGN
ncbi:MAG: tetratricopeptide repeat protein [Deltaproteobacteria bacterium]|nr:tetratricopeptide repeat protein [Deltaproteobacteria bacterium]